MKYKGYEALIKYDEDANILHGVVLNLKDIITFEADCVADIEEAFHDSVDDYLDFCAERGEEPEKPFSGRIALRLSPRLHSEISTMAMKESKSINSVIIEAVESYAMKNL